MDKNEIKETVLETLKEVNQEEILNQEEVLELSSIQVLKMVSILENKLGVEIDDRYIFHGIFKNCDVLTSYLYYESGNYDEDYWKNHVDNIN